MKPLFASLLAALFALSALSAYATPAAAGLGAPQTSMSADEDKEKDKEETKKPD